MAEHRKTGWDAPTSKLDELLLRPPPDKVQAVTSMKYSSLFILTPGNPVRRFIFYLTMHRGFEWLVILAIFANCVFLALDKPYLPTPEYMIVAEMVFTIGFTIEMTLKVLALGFVLHQGSYLRSWWNILDFLIVSLSWATFIPEFGNYTALRTFRVLRPLRSINRLPGLKRIILGLWKSLKGLLSVLSLAGLLVVIFGVIGVQLWKGLLNYRCFEADGTVLENTFCDPAVANITNEWYSQLMGAACAPTQTCKQYGGPSYGYLGFDNMGLAFLTIFQCTTMEGWADVMYMVWDVWGPLCTIYFVALVVACSFIMLNLLLAVIIENFQNPSDEPETPTDGEGDESESPHLLSPRPDQRQPKTSKGEDDELAGAMAVNECNTPPPLVSIPERKPSLNRNKDQDSVKEDRSTLEGAQSPTMYSQAINPNQPHHHARTSIGRKPSDDIEVSQEILLPCSPKSNEDDTLGVPTITTEHVNPLSSNQASEKQLTSARIQKARETLRRHVAEKPNRHVRKRGIGDKLSACLSDSFDMLPKSIKKCLRLTKRYSLLLLRTSAFANVVIFCIVLNTIFLAMEHHHQPAELTTFLDITNVVLTFIFLGEMVIKLIGFGVVRYCRDPMNILDGFVVVVSCIELMMDGNSTVSIFRALRLLRVVKMLTKFPTLRSLIAVTLSAVADTGYLNVILALYLFIAALIGIQFFGGKFDFEPLGEINPRATFDGFWWALLTVFQILTRDDWVVVMWNAMRSTSVISAFYFIWLCIFGDFLLLNLFLAILIGGFEGHEHKRRQQQQNINREAIKRLVKIQLGSPAAPSPDKKRIKAAAKMVGMAPSDRPTGPEMLTSESHHAWEARRSRSNRSRCSRSSNGSHRSHPSSYPIDESDYSSEESDPYDMTMMEQQDVVHNSRREVMNGIPDDPAELGGSWRTAISSIRVQVTETNGGRSLFLFGERNPFRLFCTRVTQNKWFERFIMFCIAFSSITLVLDNPNSDKGQGLQTFLDACDVAFVAIFVTEMLLKMVALGMVFGNGCYFKDPWNILDAVVVAISVVSLIFKGQESLSFFRVLRTFRALRPLRVIGRNSGLKTVVRTLFAAFPQIAHTVVIALLIYLVFGILGVQLFSGKLYRCHCFALSGYDPVLDPNPCIKYDRLECLELPTAWLPEWIAHTQNFDHIGLSILTLFEISALEYWSTGIMYPTIDAVDYDHAPIKDYSPVVGLFFLVFIVTGSFFILNLFVGVVIANFDRVKSQEDSAGMFLTDEQKRWIQQQRVLLNFKPKTRILPGKSKLEQLSFRMSTSKVFDYFIATCIILNTVVLAADHYDITEEFQHALSAANLVFSSIFIVEAVLKIIAFRQHYFGIGWYRFDFFLVCASGVEITLLLTRQDTGTPQDVQGVGASDNLSLFPILRMFRVFRFVRLVRAFKELHILLETLWYSLPSLANITMLMFLLFFMFAIMGMNLFGAVKHGDYLTDKANFSNFGLSFLLLFRMCTGENWNMVMHDCMIQPPMCSLLAGDCGASWAAPPYFVLFLLSTSFIMMNLFIAIVLDNFSLTIQFEKSKVQMADLKRFTDVWTHPDFDPAATNILATHKLPALLRMLGPPLGIRGDYTRLELMHLVGEYRIPEHAGIVHFIETLIPLARKQMGVQLTEKQIRDQELQWRARFPKITHLPVLRYRNVRITVEQYLASCYISAAFRRAKAREQYAKMKAERANQLKAEDPGTRTGRTSRVPVVGLSHPFGAANPGSSHSSSAGQGNTRSSWEQNSAMQSAATISNVHLAELQNNAPKHDGQSMNSKEEVRPGSPTTAYALEQSGDLINPETSMASTHNITIIKSNVVINHNYYCACNHEKGMCPANSKQPQGQCNEHTLINHTPRSSRSTPRNENSR
mmetsp:Transcript_77480/g.136679  ORF Transcript_77480/g.136679 Transcript_77480/m.136679 type:complete len:1876 (-) Transcript_77480:848-6475(-)